MSFFPLDKIGRCRRTAGIQQDPDEEQRHNKNRRQVTYNGHHWSVDEEEHALMTMPSSQTLTKNIEDTSLSWFIDPDRQDWVEQMYSCLTTLEEKINQLCLYASKGNYDIAEQSRALNVIQRHQMGGILFTQGEYKRESYLIDHYSSITKTPLIFANDFLHGISFYFEKAISLEDYLNIDPMQYLDLGKAVMVQNRRLGVQLQLNQTCFKFSGMQLGVEAFSQGVREAQGIVIEVVNPIKQRRVMTTRTLECLSFLSEPVDIKALLKNRLFTFDLLLVKENYGEVVEQIIRQVREGIYSEEEINKKVLKILNVKSLNLKKLLPPASSLSAASATAHQHPPLNFGG